MSAPAERAKAKAEGHRFYFTGRPCKRGHVTERRTSDGGCVDCKLEDQREYDARNREKRRAMNRDRRRAKHRNPEAQAERREKFRAWTKRKDEPTPLSLAAYQGPNEVNEARAWVREQATRLGVTMQFITDAIRNRWTLTEIEMLSCEDAGQLADHVGEHKPENGFVCWEPYGPVPDVGATD